MYFYVGMELKLQRIYILCVVLCVGDLKIPFGISHRTLVWFVVCCIVLNNFWSIISHTIKNSVPSNYDGLNHCVYQILC